MTDQPTHALVDHYFRHESARLVATLTGKLGIRHLPLAEDAVQVALMRAWSAWSMKGVPDQPTAWLLSVARNHAIDCLRRDARQSEISQVDLQSLSGIPDEQVHDELEDSLLRMIFACCDPSIPIESTTALALKTLCGFSTTEIARALVTTDESIAKRITRAKAQMRNSKFELADISADQMRERLASVQQVIYLLFNEGYSSSHPERMIRVELCEEAVRLALVLAEHPSTAGSASSAFLALLLFHSVRLDARLDEIGAIILFDQQDVHDWDMRLLREAFGWFERATRDKIVTRYHVEAMIAAEHCRGKLNGQTDWCSIVKAYRMLCHLSPSPVHRLNHALAVAHGESVDKGLAMLESIAPSQLMKRYYLWHAAHGELLRISGKHDDALAEYRTAWELAPTRAEKELICRKIDLTAQKPIERQK